MGAPIPDLPILEAEDSMLSRKFGRELSNYFAGSPLNRVGFLRSDHAFLRSAFSHPSARFLLLNELAPLVDESQRRLAYVGHTEVTPFTGADPFEKSEEQMIKDFNSDEFKPLILLLGLDEANKLPASEGDPGFQYKDYKGRPYFAVDVTPKGSGAEGANKVIDAVKAKGWSFYQNQRHMGLEAGEGKEDIIKSTTQIPNIIADTHTHQRPYTPTRAPSWTGTRASPSAPRAAARPSR